MSGDFRICATKVEAVGSFCFIIESFKAQREFQHEEEEIPFTVSK